MRALALIAALAALPAGLARAEGASGAPLLRPLARPVATAPLRPLARGEGALARQDSAPAGARPLARPQSVAQAAELARMLNETGTRLQRAEMPPLPQDRGTALAAATADELAVPGHLLEGRVSTMGAGSVPARLAHVEGLVDSLLGPDDPAAAVPVPVPVPAALVVPLAPAGPWAGPAPRLRPATLGQYVPGVRPAPRSAAFQAWAAAAQAPVIDTRAARPDVLMALSPLAVAQALRPGARPENFRVIVASAAPAQPPRGAAPALVSGSGICGVAILSGRTLGTVEGRGACGVENAVEITAVGGIRLGGGVTVDCQTASALADWVERVANPAVGDQGGGLARIDVGGGYSCRGRNNVAGARLSEHAFGHAIDVMGVTLRDGTRLSVLGNWGNALLREMHRGACGIFGTVLGPDANRAHRDHFHFDTARYRSGSYCR